MKVTIKKHISEKEHCCHKCDLYADDIFDGCIDDFCDNCTNIFYEVIEREPIIMEFIIKE